MCEISPGRYSQMPGRDSDQAPFRPFETEGRPRRFGGGEQAPLRPPDDLSKRQAAPAAAPAAATLSPTPTPHPTASA